MTAELHRDNIEDTILSRAGSFRMRIVLAIIIAAIFFPFVSIPFAAGWAAIYIAAQFVEAWMFKPAGLKDLLSTRRGRAGALIMVAINQEIFCSFGVVEFLRANPWMAICGMLLLMGATLNAMLTSAASRSMFRAAVGPPVLSFGVLPFAAYQAGQEWTVVAMLFLAPLLAIAAVLVIQRRFHEDFDRLEEAQRGAESANTTKSAFLATMSHEIRTPLNGVLGMTQAIAAGELSDIQRERLAVVSQSGKSLLAILDDLLDLAKIEAGRLDIEATDFSVTEIASTAHGAFSALASAKHLGFHLDVEAARGRYLGDPTRIGQILYNLISNALKFTDQGEIRVTADYDGTNLILSVRDSGIGMPAEVLPQLFEKFVQADTSTTRRFGGTGLGLAICRDLAILMGGAIEVTSEPGKGSVFTLTVPVPRIGDDTRGALGAEPAVGSGPNLALRVLAAEDNAINQLVLRTLLTQIGVEPEMVDNGQAAVDAWEREDWDVILMDVQMPVMDGPTAAAHIRRRESETGRARTPIIALTANAMHHQVAEYMASGMDGHVAKPIETAKLYEALDAALSGAARTVSADDQAG